MEEKNNIGNRIKFLRESEGYTQKELAIKLGLKGETAVANYEAGYSTPKDDIKFRMCELFNCSLDYLMCKTDIRNYDNIDKDLLDIGLSKKDYNPPTKEQQEKIEEFARFVLKDNLKRKEDK